MTQVKVYGSDSCPFSRAARRLLDKRSIPYDYRCVDDAPDVRREMESRSGGTSVPQIFIGDRHIGGFDDLSELDEDDKLDELLAGAGDA